jgi:RNA polymerase sigma-70 factor (family 1)
MDSFHTYPNLELAEQFIKRDKDAFPVLVNTYFPLLCSFAFNIVKDKDCAQDIVQEVFLRYWSGTENFPEINSLKVWLYQITRNRSLNVLRKRQRQEHHHTKSGELSDTTEASILNSIVRTETLAAIYSVVSELPEQMRSVFEMHFLEGLPIREIAAKLGITSKTVSNHRYNAVKILKSKLNKDVDALILLSVLVKVNYKDIQFLLENQLPVS